MVAISRNAFLSSAGTFLVRSGSDIGLKNPSPIIEIAKARSMQCGALVSVQGTCTVPSGLFKSSTLDVGFALQDESGGIYVPTQYNYDLQLGDTIKVTGVLGRSNEGLTTLTPRDTADVQRLDDVIDTFVVVAQELESGKITEESEGKLVTIIGFVTTPVTSDLPYGYKCYVNDGSGEVQVYISSSCNLDISPMALKGALVSITGFSGQYNTVYEVQPRIQDDLSNLKISVF